MSEQRRWTLYAARPPVKAVVTGAAIDFHEVIEVCPVSELDAALAERDALKAQTERAETALREIVMHAVLASSVTWLHRRIIESAEPVLGPAAHDARRQPATEQWVCPTCGDRTKVDEDGCCKFCGEDCTIEPLGQPATEGGA